MRILLINTFERKGGPAIATYRLMEALKSSGIKAKMLVRDKQTDQVTVVPLRKSWWKVWQFIWERLVIWMTNGFKRHNLMAVDIANTGTDITSLPEFTQADVIHLNWINQGMLSLNDLQKIFQSGKPVVWTLHDMWPITGICHYANECNRYQEACHSCPMLVHPKRQDLSHQVFRRKPEIYQSANLTFVTCSRWLEGVVGQSALAAGCKITNIPNAINTNLFRPADQEAARRKLHLPSGKKLLLFSSMKITDKRKGIDYLIEACLIMQKDFPEFSESLGIVVLGQESQQYASLFPFPVYCIDYMSSEKELPVMYNAVDLFITPSLQDNLPNTIVEAMACGVPCVGFNVGGIPQMIDHLHNGYVAQYKSAGDLANGIHWSLTEGDYESLSYEARRKAVGTYSEQIVARQYIQIYNQITGSNA